MARRPEGGIVARRFEAESRRDVMEHAHRTPGGLARQYATIAAVSWISRSESPAARSRATSASAMRAGARVSFSAYLTSARVRSGSGAACGDAANASTNPRSLVS